MDVNTNTIYLTFNAIFGFFFIRIIRILVLFMGSSLCKYIWYLHLQAKPRIANTKPIGKGAKKNKNSEAYNNPFWEKSKELKRRKKKEK